MRTRAYPVPITTWSGENIENLPIAPCTGVASASVNSLSYSEALGLWEARQIQVANSAHRPKTKQSAQLIKAGRALAIARAKDWAAAAFGIDHNRRSNFEDVKSSLPDHTQGHPEAQLEDIKFHLHKAAFSIGLDWDTSFPVVSHPSVHQEYILLLLRFRSSSLPNKERFALLVQIFLIHLKQASTQIDRVIHQRA